MYGKVIQVMKGDGYIQVRLAVNDNYDTVALVEIDETLMTQGNILEDDYITIRGMSFGEMDYTTVLGAEKSIPAVIADELDQ